MLSQSKFPQFIAFLNAAIFSGAQIAFVVLYPILSHNLAIPMPLLLTGFGVGSFLFLFSSPFWARKSDQLGREKVLQIGLTALLLSFSLIALLVYFAPSNLSLTISIFLISRILYGLVASAIAPVCQALQVDMDDERTKAMLLHSQALSLGRVLSLLLLLLFHEQYKLILIVYVLIILAAIFLTRKLTLPSIQYKIDASKVLSFSKELVAIYPVFIIAFLFACYIEGLNSTLSVSIQSIFQVTAHESSEFVSKVLLFVCFGILLVQVIARRIKKISQALGLSGGIFFLALGTYFLFQSRSQIEFWISLFFLTIGIGILPPMYLSVLQKDKEQQNYGTKAGLIGSAHTLGYSLGILLAALLIRFQINIGTTLLILVFLMGVFSFGLVFRKSKQFVWSLYGK
ncbi:MAG: MFS transporter [Oligoflexia bacterium]|nr:MFS transporter [Oligoflexia bacterium]